MSQHYEKPMVESEPVFETLAAGCGFTSTTVDTCFPDGLGVLDQSA